VQKIEIIIKFSLFCGGSDTAKLLPKTAYQLWSLINQNTKWMSFYKNL